MIINKSLTAESTFSHYTSSVSLNKAYF